MKTTKNSTRKKNTIDSTWTETSETLHAMQLDAAAGSVVDIETGVVMLLEQMTAIRRELPSPTEKLSDASVTTVLQAIDSLNVVTQATSSAVEVQAGVAAVLSALMGAQMTEGVARLPQMLEALMEDYRAQGCIVEATDGGYSVRMPERTKSNDKDIRRKRATASAGQH